MRADAEMEVPGLAAGHLHRDHTGEPQDHEHRGPDEAAEGTDELRADQIDLTFKEVTAIGAFSGQRRAIAWRSALEDIADVDFFAAHAAGRQDAVQELPGGADERFAESVFVAARGFADDAEFGVHRSDAEDRLCPRGYELGTALAGSNLLGEDGEFASALVGRRYLSGGR